MGLRAPSAGWLPPVGGVVAPNAAIVIAAFGDYSYELRDGKRVLEVESGIWGRAGLGSGQDDHWVLLRPPKGDWPAPGFWRRHPKLTLLTRAAGEHTAEIPIGREPATAPPSLKWSGPVAVESMGPSLGGEMRYGFHFTGLSSAAGPVVYARLRLDGAADQAGAIDPRYPHVEFREPPPYTLVGVQLTDVAGNVATFGDWKEP